MLSTTLSLSLFYNSNKLFLLDVPKKMPEGLKNIEIEVNNKKIKAYKFDYSDIYYINFTSSYNFILLWMVSFFVLGAGQSID